MRVRERVTVRVGLGFWVEDLLAAHQEQLLAILQEHSTALLNILTGRVGERLWLREGFRLGLEFINKMIFLACENNQKNDWR